MKDGEMAGLNKMNRRVEAIKIQLKNAPYSGSVVYKTNLQTKGWLPEVKNGAVAGLAGKSKQVEAITVYLTGEMANHYDIYYRVNVQSLGWTGWAKNGETAGSSGYSRYVGGMEVTLVPKGGTAPGSTANAFIKK